MIQGFQIFLQCLFLTSKYEIHTEEKLGTKEIEGMEEFERKWRKERFPRRIYENCRKMKRLKNLRNKE